MPTANGRPTLATIAAAAGVSVATVSKVVNERRDVSPSTRGLVQTLLHQHDYVRRRRNVPAPVEATQRRAVELVFQGPLTAYSTEVMQGVLDAASDSGVAVVLKARARGERETNPGRPSAWSRDVVAAGRRAVIAVVNDLTAGDLQALSRARLPIVVIDPLNMPRVDVTSVGSTNFAGGLTATQHLLALGHRGIGYVGGPRTASCNQARMQGYRAAMEAESAPVPEGYIRIGHFQYEHGIDAGTALLRQPQRPTAVFAGSDEIALGVIEAARAHGIRVPEDLSVVGFDDTHVARLSSPPLTTVRQPLQDMGRVALRTALRLAAGERVDSNHVELATHLVLRASTMRPLDEAAESAPRRA